VLVNGLGELLAAALDARLLGGFFRAIGAVAGDAALVEAVRQRPVADLAARPWSATLGRVSR